jgi:hypothetical protein
VFMVKLRRLGTPRSSVQSYNVADQTTQAGAYLTPRGAEVWTYERALKTAQESEGLGVVWLEEPLPRYDDEHLASLCDRINCIRTVSMYIAGSEGNVGLHEFRASECVRTLVEGNVYDISF